MFTAGTAEQNADCAFFHNQNASDSERSNDPGYTIYNNGGTILL